VEAGAREGSERGSFRSPPLIVLDTGVVIGALMGREDASNYQVCRAVGTGDLRLAISDDFMRELSRVVGSADVEPRILSPARAFRIALDIGYMGHIHHPTRYNWPSIEDPNDGWMLDLAWEARADCIVSRDPHLTRADLPFPVWVLEPH
jgi:putative PIN family toxin of toxin-antitoxin system